MSDGAGRSDGPARRLHHLDRSFFVALAALCLVGLGIRLVNVYVWRPTTVGCELVRVDDELRDDHCYETGGDALYHLVQGEAIARGEPYVSSAELYVFGDVRPGAGDPPMYAAFLGLVSALGGTGGATGRLVGLLILAGLVAAGVLIARWRAGARGARVALALGGLAALALVVASVVPVHRIDSRGDAEAVLPTLGGRVATGPGFDLLDGTSHRTAAALVGVAGIALLAILAGRLAGRRAGLLTGAIAAVYPMLWINDAMILSENLYVPMLALAMLAGLELWRSPTPKRAALVGVLGALAALTRAEALLLLVAMVPAIVLGARWLDLRRRVLIIGVGAVAAAVTVAPWMAWNLARFEEPALMTSQTWAVFSASACDTAYGLSEGGRYIGYYANCYGELVEAGLAEWPPGDLDESQRDAWNKDATTAYISEHLDRLPVVMAARVGRMWDLYRPGQNTYLNWSIEGRGRTASWIGLAAYYPLLLLSIGALAVLRRRRLPISPFVGMAVIVTVTAAITFGTTRYRVPVDAGMVVLAGVALDALLRRFGSGTPEVPGSPREDEADVVA